MNQFNTIQLNRPKYSKFDLSHEKKLSCNMGELVPIYLQEIIPGDRFKVSTEILMRLAPMISPVMHRVNVFTHYFFVPNRIVWEDWESFITGGTDGTDAPVHPFLKIKNSEKAKFYEGTLADYFGIPVTDSGMTVTQDVDISALPFRAYQTIYDEYYRDQNLVSAIDTSTGSGEANGAEMVKATAIRIRSWEKDYFTSALPWAQRLTTPVQMPIAASFVPQYQAISDVFDLTGSVNDGTLGSTPATGTLITDEGGSTPLLGRVENLVNPQLITSSSLTINDLRTSVRLQEWLEKNARGGARYIEQLLHHFGVSSSNKALQRPQYLGGSRNKIIISEVLVTAETREYDSDDIINPVGTMAGHGISYGKGNGFNKFFEEHGYVIGIMSVLPRTTYQQGLDKTWRRFDKLDYAWPEFAQLGEQEVTLGEVYIDHEAASGHMDTTFGYQSRYAEYKYNQSSVHGEFRSSLDFWHMGRIFTADPALTGTFVTANGDETGGITHRIFAVETVTVDKLYCQIYNSVSAVRALPYYNDPTL